MAGNGRQGLIAGLAGGTTVVGLSELIKLFSKKVEAAPEGATLITLDEWTKDAITVALGLLGDVSLKLNILGEISGKLDVSIDQVDALIPEEDKPAKGFAFDVVPIEAQHIAMISPTPLYETGPGVKGSIVLIELMSDSADIDYDLIFDTAKWSFNIADMVEQSIEYPHYPGAWIAKATGGQFVFMFSSGGVMGMNHKDHFDLIAKATTEAEANIIRGTIVRKVYE